MLDVLLKHGPGSVSFVPMPLGGSAEWRSYSNKFIIILRILLCKITTNKRVFTFLAWNSFCGIKVIETIRRQHSNSPLLFMYSSGFIQFATLNGTSLSSASLTLHRYCRLCIFPAKVDIVIPRMNSKRKHFIVQMNIVALYDERVPFSQWKCDWICLKGNWMKLLCGIIIIYIVLII